MEMHEIEALAFYKIKTVGKTVVYRVMSVGPTWVDVTVLDSMGRWAGNKSISTKEFLKLVEMRVKPR